MREDYVATGKCNFDILKKIYMELQLVWGVPKHSPYLEEIHRGLVPFQSSSLMDYY